MTMPVRTVWDGTYTALGITANTNLVAAGTAPDNPNSGCIYRVIVEVAPSSTAYILDSAGTTQSAANTILTIPSSTVAGTVYYIMWRFYNGLSVLPGSGTLAVSYSVGDQG